MSASQLAGLARLLADESRAAFCLALLDGRAWTASELAGYAGIAPATATEHLHKLVAAGLLEEQRQGRHRYVRLAGPRVAQLIEELSSHLEPPAPAKTLRAATVSAALARGRTCYDHLAGRLGVAIADALARDGLLNRDTGFALTDSGVRWLDETLGAGPESAGPESTGPESNGPASTATASTGPAGTATGSTATGSTATRRPLARGCLDWTERREHVAGIAGARICRTFLDRGWTARIGTGRAIRVTPAGAEALTGLFGPDPAWEPA
jgi:DNA-binding transcriptional ArsR family regulator